jgi:menaquinone-dependent protoporphyrinogen oxidase
MDKKILVAYATKYGATAEIAQKIGQVLTEAGLAVDVLPAGQVRDVQPYGAVVLGSAVYVGAWRKEAARFLQLNEKLLSELPVWLFSSGPLEQGDPVELLQGWRLPKGLQPVADRIHPRDVAVFHGAIYEEKLNSLDKWMLKTVKSQVGDFRDWQLITAWATSISEALR